MIHLSINAMHGVSTQVNDLHCNNNNEHKR